MDDGRTLLSELESLRNDRPPGPKPKTDSLFEAGGKSYLMAYPRKSLVLVDLEDALILRKFRWSILNTGYAAAKFARRGKHKTFLLHRVIMNAPMGMTVDHINGNKLDNRRRNLRLATKSQNCINRPKYPRKGLVSTSEFKGVFFSRDPKRIKRWKAEVRHMGRAYYAGRYDTAVEAAVAYDKKAVEVYGEFARLNFPKAA